jgi:triosephosphate isomerase
MTALVGTSWKMNLTASDAERWLGTFVEAVSDIDGVELFVLPPFTAIWVARARLDGTGIAWGAQDVHPADSGAHTGDVSAPMIADLGCTWVEVGHHERRRDHGETPDLIGAKVEAVVRHGLRPILCVGETRPVSTAEATKDVIDDLERCLGILDAEQIGRVVVAYEPVWAIGEGASPAETEHVGRLHASIHDWLRQRSGLDGRVIYGGSVDEHVAPELLREPGVDGLFVGRRALDAEAFARLVRACAEAVKRPDERYGPASVAGLPEGAETTRTSGGRR